jgi:hypothetical protein
MADQGRWFKLWCSCIPDPSLDNLPIADFGRWAKLGAIIKEQGTEGVLIVSEPARLLCAALQIETFSLLIACVSRFPNVTVSLETNTSVSYRIEYGNWLKYQGDYSTQRVRAFRAKNDAMKRSKRRGEEKRREEKRSTPIVPVGDFERFWIAYPKKLGKDPARKAWEKLLPQNGLVEIILSSVEAHKMTPDWQKDHGQFIPYPATFLNGRRWEDVLTPEASTPPIVRDPRTTWKTREKYQAGLKAGAVHPSERIAEWEPSTT